MANNNDNINPYLTCGEAAKHLHVSHGVVRKWVKSGKLKSHSLPRLNPSSNIQYRFHVFDLVNFLIHFEIPIPKKLSEHHEMVERYEDTF